MRVLALADRHICRTVLLATGAVFLAFAGLLSLFALLEELNEDEAAYTLGEAAWYVLLTLPRRGYELLPYALFLGSLIGLGQLASQLELVALRAAGASMPRLFAGLAWAVLGGWLAGAALGEWLAPEAEARAETRKALALDGGGNIRLAGGHWYREGPFYMHVGALAADGRLLNIRQYRLHASGRLQWTRRAASAEYVAGEDPHWLLREVAETRLDEKGAQVREFPELRWRSQADPRLLSERMLLDPRRLSLRNLHRQIAYMEREGLDPTSYRLAFWSKCLQPAAALGLALLAFAFVLGPLREAGIAVRISAGAMVGLCFKYLQDLFAPMSQVYGLDAPLAVAAPIALCWALALIAVRRAA